jgi:glycosyltransferase involved in cell wall biosynthesis
VPLRPWRIDLVTETWPPEVNGVAMTLARLTEGLRARGHLVRVVRPRQPGDGPPGRRRRGASGDVLRPGWALPMYRDLRFGLPCRQALERLWSRRPPDLVHLATEGPLGWSGLKAAERLRLPICSSFHTHFEAYSRHYGLGFLAGWVEEQLGRFHARCGATLVPGPDLAERLRARGVPGVHVMGRGVDTERFAPALRDPALRAAWGLGAEDLALVVSGRLASEKNLPLAVRVLEALRRQQPGTRLVLIGDGPERARLARVPGVVLVGSVPHAEVGRPLASCDLFLFPSLTETFGNVLLEAMASGLASLSFRYAASALHVVDGVNGRHVAPGDEGAFLGAAQALAAHADVRARLGVQARESALRVGWEHVVDAYERAAAPLIAASPLRTRPRESLVP